MLVTQFHLSTTNREFLLYKDDSLKENSTREVWDEDIASRTITTLISMLLDREERKRV